MFHSAKSKSTAYWIVVVLLVLIIPMAVFYFMGKPGLKNFGGNKSGSQKFNVPMLSEQPTDTLISSKIIPIHYWETNGVKVVFVPTEKLPIIDIDVSFAAGSARDGDQYGLANVTAAMLDQGTIKMPDDADGIAQIFENAGAKYSASVSKDRVRVLLRTLSNINDLKPVIDLFADVIVAPSFDEEAINRVKKLMTTEINYQQQIPSIVAKKEFTKTLYKDHPYAHQDIGTIDTVATISKEDLHKFHQQFYVANNATITIVGGLHRDKARKIAKHIITKLNPGQKAATLPQVTNVNSSVIRNVSRPVNQAQILLGRVGTTVLDPDNYAINLGNYILGAPFTSRIFKQIRIKKGLAYSAYSTVSPLAEKGVFISGLQTKTDQAKTALNLLRNIITEFQKNGPTSEELDMAKKHLIGSMAFWFESNKNILAATSKLNFYNLPFDYFDTYQVNIENVTKEDVVSVFTNKLNFKNTVQVVLSEDS